MEMHENTPAVNPAEVPATTPAAAPAAAAEETAAIETVAPGIDPEEAAEDEMTAAIEGEEAAEEADALRRELTAAEVLEAARAVLAKDAADISADDVRRLRQHFGAFHTVSEAGEGVEAQGPMEEEFKALLSQIREKKAMHTARIEAEQLAALEKKRAIVAEIEALAADTDNVNRTFPRYRELQDEFNATGDVPPTEDTAIWKAFQEAREHYSDNLKINKELRDYDFKKNLDSKQLLLAEAESLVAEEDVILAYRRLQELHNKWRQIGPVAKEVREEIWDKFKTFSAEVNKRYQAYFEARKAREAENEAGKAALCERLEAIDITAIKTFGGWDKATAEVLAIQQEWRKYGFASKKANKALFNRFRGLCDAFFAAKAEYFRSTRDEQARNLARKTALAERAEALRESTDWKAATDELVALQKEWKTIGAVAKKHSDAVWQRFLAACDHFFERKKQATSGTRRAEQDNLKAKREVIAELDKISADTPRDEALARLRELQTRWQEIGHVPFRDKDKVYDAYRTAVDRLRDGLNLRERGARMERFSDNLSGLGDDRQKLSRERERLARALEGRRSELRTYENNLGFLSFKSKSGDSMLKEFERKAERLRADIAELEEKIRLIDAR
ncbi:MAG: DUF349 domain-containing protein [Bacteroides sp.]|nr:DUF349 domain-containing protein [Bacteroides sp.]MCM1096000.1 DUF349 domain-containing protein [Terasakiella sp.]